MSAEAKIAARIATFSPEKVEAFWADFLSRQDWGSKARTQEQKDAWIRLQAIQEITTEGGWDRVPQTPIVEPPHDPTVMRVKVNGNWVDRPIVELAAEMEAAAWTLRAKIQAGETRRTHYGVPERVSGANVENIHLTTGPHGPKLVLVGYGWGLFGGSWGGDETSDVIRWMRAGCPTGWAARFAGLTAMGFIAEEAGIAFRSMTCGKDFVPAAMILLG